VEPRSLQYIAAACAGEQLTGSGETLATRVCTDSRQARPGDLFIALRGDQFDGHAFLAEVARRKVAAAVVERSSLPVPSLEMAVIAVEHTRAALGRLAARYRTDFPLPAVAVGGSNGKSTTKELVASVLRQKHSTLASEASFNNDVGVPISLLQLERHHTAAVLEVGTNHPGELAPLVAMIQPRFGIITSIGREHLEFFGGLDGVLAEEGVLADLLPASGRLFLNTASEPARRLLLRSRAPVVRVGWEPSDDWFVTRSETSERGVRFVVNAPGREFCGEYRTKLLGRHQVLNAALAVAVGAEMGLSADEIRRGLAECQPLKSRLQLWPCGGFQVLDDTYNANADSMLAALHTLRDLPCSGRRIAVLGEMAELGEQSASAHAEVGRCAAESGLSQLVTVGSQARLTAATARRAGLREVIELADAAEAVRTLRNLLRAGDLVLLKASRVAGLERVSAALKTAAAPVAGGPGRTEPPLPACADGASSPRGMMAPC
jgi:UDP-N-acetylmuramoyl-tripeptide--D-alanyl-D-alanine ligase